MLSILCMRPFFLLLHILFLNLFLNAVLQKDVADQTLELSVSDKMPGALCLNRRG